MKNVNSENLELMSRLSEDRIVFQEDFDSSLMALTLKAYDALYKAYCAYQDSAPYLTNPVDTYVRSYSKDLRVKRRNERVANAPAVGEALGLERVSEKDVLARFAALDDELRDGIMMGYRDGLRKSTGYSTPATKKLAYVRARAYSKGRYCDMDLTADELSAMVPSHCPILGTRIAVAPYDPLHDNPEHTWSVERMSNLLGYDRDNMAVVSVRANEARDNLTPFQILERAAGVVEDSKLTKIQWCRLLNHHWTNLRYEDPYFSKLSPPITWQAPRYSEADPRKIANMIANPLSEGNICNQLNSTSLKSYFIAGGSPEKTAQAETAELIREIKKTGKQCSNAQSTNMIGTFVKKGARKMLCAISSEIYQGDRNPNEISPEERKIIVRASGIGCGKNWF